MRVEPFRRLRFRLPPDVRDWIQMRPPCLAREEVLDILFGLAQFISQEDNFDIEQVVEEHSDFLLESFLSEATEAEREQIEEYDTFFREVYLPASCLLDVLDIGGAKSTDLLVQSRLDTLEVSRDCVWSIVTIGKNILSHLARGDLDYLRYDDEEAS